MLCFLLASNVNAGIVYPNMEEVCKVVDCSVIVQPGADLSLTVRDKILAVFPEEPLMLEIARCESSLRQFEKDGSVLTGRVNSKDKGLFQINEYYHLDTANKLGYNIYTIDGNIKMAKYIYEQSGTKPWNASKKCWQEKKNELYAIRN